MIQNIDSSLSFLFILIGILYLRMYLSRRLLLLTSPQKATKDG